MTKLKGILTVLFIAVISISTYANSITTTAKKELRKEIANHLKDLDLRTLQGDEDTVHLSFMVNQNNEIIVLHTDNSRFDSLLKSKLNYKTIKTTEAQVNQVYAVPIKLKA